ncbi:hypothetical protein B0I35DRAFT_426992 [Stachybotrys elegans]|uniref:Uncharacterized protein n=1 Tax=Stachybotrys elegans TaxID=80388 RepID=A0A8K0WTP4_9HYPO|nr:hypothetical protein B0I35DRAFT_426992 [Stachybotrys elegans]
MDPVSIVGLVASIFSIGDMVTKSIRKLSDLRSRYRNAPLQLSTLIGQLYIIQAAVEELARWKSDDLSQNPRYHQLALQLDGSLDSFCPLITSLQKYLDDVDITSEIPSTKGKIAYLWNENDIAIFLDLIDRQINALNLFLQAIRCRNWAEQGTTMKSDNSKAIISLARDCSSSIKGLSDGFSVVSENTDRISTKFDFDTVVLATRVYQETSRSHLRQAIRAKKSQRLHSGLSAHPIRHGQTRMPMGHDGKFTPELKSSAEPSNVPKTLTGLLNKTPSGLSTIEESSPLAGAIPRPEKFVKTPPSETSLTPPSETSSTPFGPRRFGGYADVIVELAGCQGSGKTALCKGIFIALESDPAMTSRVRIRPEIWTDVFQHTIDVYQIMKILKLSFKNVTSEGHISHLLWQYGLFEMQLPRNTPDAILDLWTDEGFLEAHRRCSEFKHQDSAEYYRKHIERIIDNCYIPTNEDIMAANVRDLVDPRAVYRLSGRGRLPLMRLQISKISQEPEIMASPSWYIATLVFVLDPTERIFEQRMLFMKHIRGYRRRAISIVLVMTKTDLLDETLEHHPPAKYLNNFQAVRSDFPDTEQFKDFFLDYVESWFRDVISHRGTERTMRVVRVNLVSPADGSAAQEVLDAVHEQWLERRSKGTARGS